MRTNSNVVAELTLSMNLVEAKVLRKLLAQISQGVAPSLEKTEVDTIKVFNKELGDFVDKCKLEGVAS